MSVLGMYISIPPNSILYSYLEQQYPLRCFVHSIFSYGGGIFNFFDIDHDEIDEVLESKYEWLIQEDPAVFDSKAAFEKVVSQLRNEVIRTRESHPGIENRNAMLEGTSLKMAKCLPIELSRIRVENPDQMANYLIYGDKTIGDGIGLEAISRELVSEGASILQQVNSEALLLGQTHDSIACHEFEEWRSLYIAANENDEEIMLAFE